MSLRNYAEPRAQPRDALRMNLAHARFTHAQYLADLPEIELLLVVKRHHELLTLRQLFDCLHERFTQLAVFEHLERVAVRTG